MYSRFRISSGNSYKFRDVSDSYNVHSNPVERYLHDIAIIIIIIILGNYF